MAVGACRKPRNHSRSALGGRCRARRHRCMARIEVYGTPRPPFGPSCGSPLRTNDGRTEANRIAHSGIGVRSLVKDPVPDVAHDEPDRLSLKIPGGRWGDDFCGPAPSLAAIVATPSRRGVLCCAHLKHGGPVVARRLLSQAPHVDRCGWRAPSCRRWMAGASPRRRLVPILSGTFRDDPAVAWLADRGWFSSSPSRAAPPSKKTGGSYNSGLQTPQSINV